MKIQYFQGKWGDKPVFRGDLDNWLDFAKYDSKTKTWDQSQSAFWAHDILVDNGPYIDITKEQAEKIINGDTRESD